MKASPLMFLAFSKVEEQDDGTLIVVGTASSETRDSANEIVKANAMRAAMPDYLTFGAVREMHQPIAAGTAITCAVGDDGITTLTAHIVDPTSCLKVRTGVLKGYSIGGKVTKRNTLDKSIIEGIKLSEISLVDRPANPDALISLVKIDGSGAVTLGKSLTDVGESSPMKKSIYDVGVLAELISRLNSLMCWSQDEANWEGDNSAIPGKIKASVVALCGVLREMVDEETAELLGIADEIVTTETLIEAAAKCDGLAKKGAKFSKATVGALALVDKALADAGAVMKGIGYTKADNQQDDDTMTETEKAELAKATARVTELETANAALMKSAQEQGEQLAKATQAAADATAAATKATDTAQKLSDAIEKSGFLAKGAVRAIPKEQDSGRTTADEQLNKGEAAKPTVLSELKSAHQRPLSPIRAS